MYFKNGCFFNLGKETKENAQLLSVLETERKIIDRDGLRIGETHFQIIPKIHTLDRKAANIFNATGGSYCNLCLWSKEEAKDIDRVKAGMPITRSILHTQEILQFLCDEEGELIIRNNDYSERFGVMGQLINQVDCPDSPVLNTVLRTMNTFAKACCCLVAGVKI